MTRTSWYVTTENIAGLRRVTLHVETDDPLTVATIEAAAERAGVELVRELSDSGPDREEDE
jgi:TusA-related sulfurtransferase